MDDGNTHRLARIRIEEPDSVHLTRDAAHERAVAIDDLLRENSLRVGEDDSGPYSMVVRVVENRLVLIISDRIEKQVAEVTFPVGALRSLLRDYFQICDGYFEAVKMATPSKIEAIDMGRRGLHNEGAEIILGRLKPEITIDQQTARGLFTLICALRSGHTTR